MELTSMESFEELPQPMQDVVRTLIKGLGSFDDLTLTRGKMAMDEETADQIATRIKLHLWRGSIEQARDALNAGWQTHIAETSELPIGPALLEVHLSRVLCTADSNRGAVRTLNMLEEAGILSVDDLLRTTFSELMNIPNLGHKTAEKLMGVARSLKLRLQATSLEECGEVPANCS